MKFQIGFEIIVIYLIDVYLACVSISYQNRC